MWDVVPPPGSNLYHLPWEHGALTAGLPGRSFVYCFLVLRERQHLLQGVKEGEQVVNAQKTSTP